MNFISKSELCMAIFSKPPLKVKKLPNDELIIRLEGSEILLDINDIDCLAGIIEKYDIELDLGDFAIDFTRNRIFMDGLSKEDKKLYFSLSIFSTIH